MEATTIHLVTPVLVVTLDLPDLQDHKVLWEPAVNPENKDPLDLLDPVDHLDPTDFQA